MKRIRTALVAVGNFASRFVSLRVASMLGLTAFIAAGIALLATDPDRPAASNGLPAMQIGQPEKVSLKPSSRLVRVSVTPSRDGWTIAVDRPFVIRRLTDKTELKRLKSLGPSAVVSAADGIRIGSLSLFAEAVELVPDASPAIWVGRHQYRGVVRLHRQRGRIVAVNVLPLNHYIASVVDSEMPAKFPDEARKAQAIVARTYVLYRQSQTRGAGLFDVYGDARSQRYLGYQYRETDGGRRLAGESDDSRRITQQTAGLVCTYRGQLFAPYYSAVCGGRTTAGYHLFKDASPALQSVTCHWCRDAKRYRWTVSVPYREANAALRNYLSARNLAFGNLRSIRPLQQSFGSSPPEFHISDGPHLYRIKSKQVRDAISPSKLPSPYFEVRFVGNDLVFHGRGHGHAVGLCQWGAAGQARSGRTAAQIIGYYYRGATVTRQR
jgi:stage II sporulation protein D (peptidoglycan lytic transglycosylase)